MVALAPVSGCLVFREFVPTLYDIFPSLRQCFPLSLLSLALLWNVQRIQKQSFKMLPVGVDSNTHRRAIFAHLSAPALTAFFFDDDECLGFENSQ